MLHCENIQHFLCFVFESSGRIIELSSTTYHSPFDQGTLLHFKNKFRSIRLTTHSSLQLLGEIVDLGQLLSLLI